MTRTTKTSTDLLKIHRIGIDNYELRNDAQIISTHTSYAEATRAQDAARLQRSLAHASTPTCAWCGAEFSNRGGSKYCSDGCVRQADANCTAAISDVRTTRCAACTSLVPLDRPYSKCSHGQICCDQTCVKVNDSMHWDKPQAADRCSLCCKNIDNLPAVTITHLNGLFCSDRCAAMAQADYEAMPDAPLTSRESCLTCGNTLTSATYYAMNTCSAICLHVQLHKDDDPTPTPSATNDPQVAASAATDPADDLAPELAAMTADQAWLMHTDAQGTTCSQCHAPIPDGAGHSITDTPGKFCSFACVQAEFQAQANRKYLQHMHAANTARHSATLAQPVTMEMTLTLRTTFMVPVQPGASVVTQDDALEMTPELPDTLTIDGQVWTVTHADIDALPTKCGYCGTETSARPCQHIVTALVNDLYCSETCVALAEKEAVDNARMVAAVADAAGITPDQVPVVKTCKLCGKVLPADADGDVIACSLLCARKLDDLAWNRQTSELAKNTQ